MKNMCMVILSAMMIGATGYALEEPQGFIDVYTIPTKNAVHRDMLNIMHEGSRDGARAIMSDDRLLLSLLRHGQYEAVRQIRMRAREQALQLQDYWRQEAQQELKRWGYAV